MKLIPIAIGTFLVAYCGEKRYIKKAFIQEKLSKKEG